ncbi:MAG: mechanosensitive ion channel family protein [Bacteroidales bacterium]|nr:mechanosensitive ion channel family protein [Bacteroidales bacterium]
MIYWIFGNVIKRITSRSKTKIDDIIVDTLEEPVILSMTIFGLWYGFRQLVFPETIDNWINLVYHVLVAITVTWLVARLVDAIIREYLIPLAEKSESTVDDQMIPLIRKGLRSIIGILGIIVALNNAGYNVGALLAGLGIGGLALAMAAKDTVANIFGGITIFTDKPFRINDRIKIDGFDGNITEIGIRSTRLKTLEGRIVTIPNSKFTDGMVENISSEPSRKVVLNLGLVYETSVELMEKAMELLKQIGTENPSTEDDVLVGFNDFGASSLGIVFIYYIRKSEDILNTQTTINLAIKKEFEKHGLELAFPTQTVYTIRSN